MNKEEIEELKDFTIDLTDIDELALGLEVCSKKSNMVIQEFADTIIQLQQENQELKKQLEEKQNPFKGIFAQVNDDTLLRDCGNMNAEINELKTQQKEFIEYLEKTIEELECGDAWDRYKVLVVNKILSKYKEIIGGK